MSHLADIKNELLRVTPSKTSERVAELASVMRFAGGLHRISNRLAVEVELDSAALAKRVCRDIIELYGVKPQVIAQPGAASKRDEHYVVRVLDQGETLARQTGLLDPRDRPVRGLPNRLTTGSRMDLAAIWRGAFLVRGTLSEPGRSASLEVTCPTNEAAMALTGAAGRLGIQAKSREIRGSYRVIVREPEAIGALLRFAGAGKAVSEWEEQRAQRATRATANRLVNFDDANLRRSAQAAVAACARVERALEILGDDVPEHLLYAGKLRLEHRDASLDELGHHADPPLTKDAVAGRIRRLLAMAERRASEEGIPGTDANLTDEMRGA